MNPSRKLKTAIEVDDQYQNAPLWQNYIWNKQFSDLPENLNANKLFCYFARKQSAKRWFSKFNGSGGRKKLNSVRGLRIVAQVAGAEQISAHLLNLPDLPDLQPEKYLHIEPCTHMEHLLIPFCICRHLYSFKKRNDHKKLTQLRWTAIIFSRVHLSRVQEIAMSSSLIGDIVNNAWSPNKREVLWGEAGQVWEAKFYFV